MIYFVCRVERKLRRQTAQNKLYITDVFCVPMLSDRYAQTLNNKWSHPGSCEVRE
jgi:hypothetical protein